MKPVKQQEMSFNWPDLHPNRVWYSYCDPAVIAQLEDIMEEFKCKDAVNLICKMHRTIQSLQAQLKEINDAAEKWE